MPFGNIYEHCSMFHAQHTPLVSFYIHFALRSIACCRCIMGKVAAFTCNMMLDKHKNSILPNMILVSISHCICPVNVIVRNTCHFKDIHNLIPCPFKKSKANSLTNQWFCPLNEINFPALWIPFPSVKPVQFQLRISANPRLWSENQ